MKLLLVVSLFIANSFALDFKTNWSDSFEKSIVMTCSVDDSQCRETCGNEKQCVFAEEVCRNCIGTSIYMTHLFKTMGQVYRNNGVEVTTDEVVSLLASGSYASISAKSIYNHVDKFNSRSLRVRFQSLCSNSTQEPIVILSMNKKTKILGDVQYVLCQDESYEMENNPDVVMREESLIGQQELY